MALTEGMLIEVTLKQNTWAGYNYNVFGYEITAGLGEIEAVALAEAWWNYVKDEWRAIVRPTSQYVFQSVIVREMNNPTGDLAEWNVPTAEQQGTRTAVSASHFLPPFNAAGVRFTVGSRATRPGQKRFGGLTEDDVAQQVLVAEYVAVLTPLADELSEVLTLASPAVSYNLTPSVFAKDATGAVTAHQVVTGFVINPNATSQVSRKMGRGI